MNLVDTSGWIEYFFGGPNARFFSVPVEATSDLIVPVICLFEVFKKVNLAADEARALQAVAHMNQGTVVDLTESIALSAALLSIRHKLPMVDSTILAIARTYDALVWTQDSHFSDLPGVKFIEAGIT